MLSMILIKIRRQNKLKKTVNCLAEYLVNNISYLDIGNDFDKHFALETIHEDKYLQYLLPWQIILDRYLLN